MKIDINPRGNGACPLCRLADDCRIKRLLISNAEALNGTQEEAMEIVIYSCPYFQEKTDL